MKEQSGFTLLEVLVAVLIFSIGLLAVATMQVRAIRGNNYSGALTEASYWATDQMEELLSLDFANVDLQDTDGDGAAGLNHSDDPNADGDPAVDATGSQADFQQLQGIYSISYNVADEVPTSNTKTINVLVTWTERGSQKTLALQGIKAR